MRGAAKVLRVIIILLQGAFAGVLLGQMLHLFFFRNLPPFLNLLVPVTMAGSVIGILFFRKKIQQYLFSVGNILWIHYAAPILFGGILLLHLISVLYHFEDSSLIVYTFQLSSLFALVLVVAENYVLHIAALQNVYADLLRKRRLSPLLKNLLWLISLAIFTVISMAFHYSGGESLAQVLTTSLYLCSGLFFFLLGVKLKVMDMLKCLPLQKKEPQEYPVEEPVKASFAFSNYYYTLERKLLRVLPGASTEERQMICEKIRQMPLIDKIQELEEIQDRYFPEDGELEYTLHFLRRLQANMLDKEIHYDLDSESSILEIKAFLRIGIQEGNSLLVQKLLNDNRPEVKKAAIFATIHFNELSFIPALVNLLKDHEFAFAVNEALFQSGEKCLPFLRAAKFRNKDNSFFISQCLELVQRFRSDEARDFLVEMLNESQKIFQYRAAVALIKNEFSLSSLHKTQILGFIESLIGVMATQREIRHSLQEHQRQLAEALLEEEKEKRALLEDLLCVFLPVSVRDMFKDMLENGPGQNTVSVFSIIDLYFPLSLRGKCKIFLGSSMHENIAPALQNDYMNEQVCFNFKSQEEAIRQILKMDYGLIGYWLRACALKSLVFITGQQVSLLILAEIFNKNPMLQEVACEVLYNLNYDYYFLQMQRLPTERAKFLKYKIENNKLLNENRDIEENQLLFNKVLELRSFAIFKDFSFEGLARKTELFSLVTFSQTKQKLKFHPYEHCGYWMVVKGRFTLYHWGDESLKAEAGDIVDMSLLIEAEPNSLSIRPEGDVKIYFIEYFTLNRLYLASGYSGEKSLHPKLEQATKLNLA